MAPDRLLPDRLTLAGEQPRPDLRMPRPPGVIRRYFAEHPRVTDALIALSYWLIAAGFTVLLAVSPQNPPPWYTAAYLVAVTAGATALLFRRRRPWLVLGAAGLVTLASAPFVGIADLGMLPLALYALVIYRSPRAGWVGFAASVVVVTAASVLGTALARDFGDQTLPIAVGSGAVQFGVLLVIVMLIAINIRNRRAYVAALVDRAATLVREREQLAQLAALDERSRIAREMHDIVSHSLTVMVTVAEGSAAIAASDADRAVEGMRRVAETGRTALADMRRMLGVLAESDDGATASLEPQPDIAELPRLVERFRAAGLPVRLTMTGVPPEDPAHQLALYRIVQESLTNVLRHAVDPTEVEASLRFTRRTAAVTVTNNGSPVSPSGTTIGHGLAGMRERVALYSGTLSSGPIPSGGWRTEAELKLDGATTRRKAE